MNLACRGYSVENELIGFGCNASILYCHQYKQPIQEKDYVHIDCIFPWQRLFGKLLVCIEAIPLWLLIG
jgi:hypothetical protein